MPESESTFFEGLEEVIEHAFDAFILVAEDDPVNQEVVGMMLDVMGCRFDTAQNGGEAVELAGVNRYDLIFMDCQMPVLDGFEATARIRQIEAAKGTSGARVPIVAMTGNTAEEDQAVCLANGMDYFLCKPFTFEELKELLERCLSSGKAVLPGGNGVISAEEIGEVIDRRYVENIIALQRPGDPDLLGKVVDHFYGEYPQVIAGLERAVDEGDLETLCSVSHRFKSASANLGAVGLAEACRELEKGARTNSENDNRRLLARIKSEFGRAETALNQIRQGKAQG